jgi:hypothetical protein
MATCALCVCTAMCCSCAVALQILDETSAAVAALEAQQWRASTERSLEYARSLGAKAAVTLQVRTIAGVRRAVPQQPCRVAGGWGWLRAGLVDVLGVDGVQLQPQHKDCSKGHRLSYTSRLMYKYRGLLQCCGGQHLLQQVPTCTTNLRCHGHIP